MEYYYSAIKAMSHRYMQQPGWISRELWLVKKANLSTMEDEAENNS
jgi:hypothetical protein